MRGGGASASHAWGRNGSFARDQGLDDDQVQVADWIDKLQAEGANDVPRLDFIPGTDRSSLDERELASVESWETGLPSHLASAARAAAVAASKRALGEPWATRPATDDPASMLGGLEPRSPAAAPPPADYEDVPEPDDFAYVRGRDIVSIHRRYHAGCSATCHVASLARLVDCCGENLWKDEPPPTRLLTRADFADERCEPRPEAMGVIARKLHSLGITRTVGAGEAVTVSRAFLVQRRSVTLDEDQLRRVSEGDTLEAAAIARGIAARFLRAYERGGTQTVGAFFDALDTVMTVDGERLVVDLAHGERRGEFIPATEGVNSFAREWRFRSMRLSDLLAHAKPGGFFMKADLEKGYYHIRLGRNAQRHFAVIIDGVAYAFRRLPMGLTSSAAIFSYLTGEVNSWLRAEGHAACICFLDDFLIYGDTAAAAEAAMACLKHLCAAIGLRLSPAKTSAKPLTAEVLLGLRADSVAGTLSVAAKSLVKTLAYSFIALDCSRAALGVPRSFLASAAGGVGWLGQVNALVPPFTRALYSVAEQRHHRRALMQIDGDVRAALEFIERGAANGWLSGEGLLACAPARTRVYITSDASGEANAAVSIGPVRLRIVIPCASRMAVPILEDIALAVAAVRYAPVAQGAWFITGSDSAVVAFWRGAFSSGRGDAIDLFRIESSALHSARMPHPGSRWYTRAVNHKNDRSAAATTDAQAAAAGVTHTITLPDTPTGIARWLAAQVPSLEGMLGSPFAPSPDWDRERKVPARRWYPAGGGAT